MTRHALSQRRRRRAGVRIEDGRISGMYYVRNPPKLSRVGAEIPLVRR
jgi:hypothetical protein